MTTKSQSNRARPSWFSRFWAIVRYEMLWNIRKKRFIGALIFAFIFATLGFAIPSFFDISENPYFAITFSAGNLTFVLFAVVTAMNSISGEYESGTIVPLLTKPVSRTMVFLGKLFAIFVIIISAYVVIYVYSIIGGLIVYGPQNNLHLVPLALIGDLIATFIWVSIVLAAGAISKNSLLAFLMSFGLFVALAIGGGLVSQFAGNPPALNYFPGTGASGTMNISGGQNVTIQNVTVNTLASVSTGTDSIGTNMIKSVLYPDANVSFYSRDVFNLTSVPQLLYTEPISLIALRSIGVAFVYIAVFLFIAWFAFKRSQVLE
ncbi:MAG: ABC transporter permease [Candidatus Bathyarchaeota archaeon]|nr:ABC transporter permease [Candidatus Bathyarchaeota archaeon]